MNKRYYPLILFILFFIIADLILFFYILGPSVFIFTGILILLVLFMVGYYYYYNRGIPGRPKFIAKQNESLDSGLLSQERQSMAANSLENSNFIIHKRIIMGELVIIVILFLNLILKIW